MGGHSSVNGRAIPRRPRNQLSVSINGSTTPDFSDGTKYSGLKPYESTNTLAQAAP